MPTYHNKTFRPVQNTDNGETSAETRLFYLQTGNVLSVAYQGGKIIQGHLLGLVDASGCIEMVYYQIHDKGEIMRGKC